MQLAGEIKAVEVSVVIPCLNEQDTLARCTKKARQAFREHNITGEILVADNGSTDASRAIAEGEGARNGGSPALAIWIMLARCD